MTTLTLTELVGEPREWEAKSGPVAGQKFHSYKVKDDKGTVYEINRKATSPPPDLGQGDYEITPPKEGTTFPPKIKKVYSGGGGGGGMSPERQRAIQRQHSEEMAVRALVLIHGTGPHDGPTVSWKDEIAHWADWFDADVNRVAGVDVGGGEVQTHRGHGATHLNPAADVSAEPPTTAQRRAITTLLNKAGCSKDFQRTIVLSFADPLTKSAASRILDVLNDEALGVPEQRVDALLRESGLERPGDLPEPDMADLEPQMAVGAADESVPF